MLESHHKGPRENGSGPARLSLSRGSLISDEHACPRTPRDSLQMPVWGPLTGNPPLPSEPVRNREPLK